MGSFLFSLFLTLSLCSASALTPSAAVAERIEMVDPYMLGVCEGIASVSMTVTDMQLKKYEKNLLVFSITDDEKRRQDFYCFQCSSERAENEMIVLTSVNDAELACSEVPQ